MISAVAYIMFLFCYILFLALIDKMIIDIVATVDIYK